MMEHDLLTGQDAHDAQAGDDALPALPLAAGYQRLEDAILDDCFPEVDLALRRGRHIHKGDERWFRFLSEAQGLLETFYRRFGCELEQRSDGYFFLLPVSDGLGKRALGVPEMIVGQGLALCYLDPQSVQNGGVVTREELLNQLAAVMGTDALMHTLNPKRKRVDERVMQRTVRQKVNEALRRLSLLGFVELLDAEQLRLAPSLMRFAEPVRGLDAPSEALKRLIERGEVSLGPGDAEARDADDDEPNESDADPNESDAVLDESDAAIDETDAVLATSAPEPPRASPHDGATYEAFPANDAGHAAPGSEPGSDSSARSAEPADVVAVDAPYGDTDDEAGDDDDRAGALPRGYELDARAADADASGQSPEHVEIDFDWDTLPDEEA